MTNADMWGDVVEAASMLAASDCDWRTLQQTEALLSSVTTELERVSAEETGHAQYGSSARHADADLCSLQSSLAWVRRHEYVALESALQQQLDTALQCALRMLDRLGEPQDETRLPPLSVVAPSDGR